MITQIHFARGGGSQLVATSCCRLAPAPRASTKPAGWCYLPVRGCSLRPTGVSLLSPHGASARCRGAQWRIGGARSPRLARYTASLQACVCTACRGRERMRWSRRDWIEGDRRNGPLTAPEGPAVERGNSHGQIILGSLFVMMVSARNEKRCSCVLPGLLRFKSFAKI